MTTPVHILDGAGSKTAVKVSTIGQLTTAPFAFDETVFNELAEDDTAYNFYPAKAGQQFVITGIIAVADKQVSSTVSADIVVYEATTEATTVVSKVLIQTAMVQDQIQPFSNLNILVTEGFFINAKTTDDDIHMTVMGYFIPKLA